MTTEHHTITEAKARLAKPFTRYSNTDWGYQSAIDDFQDLMHWTLGTDCGKEINDLLDQKRWAMQDFYKRLHKWDIC
jgi:hypothetical protein